MKWSILLATIVIGCGGSNRGATDPAARAREAERKRIEGMRPERPYETLAVRGYRAPDTCGQGPYRVEAAALGAHFGERLEVNICAPRSLQGDYRLTKGPDTDEPRHFGSRNNSDHCLATATEAAQRAAPTAATSSNPVNAGATSRASSGVRGRGFRVVLGHELASFGRRRRARADVRARRRVERPLS